LLQNVSHVLHANERKERANKLGAAGVRRLPGVARQCCWWWWRRLTAAVRWCARSGWRCQTTVLPFLCSVFFFFLCFFFSPFLSPASLSLLPLFFFPFRRWLKVELLRWRWGGTAMAESRHSGCDNQCCCFPSSSQCCSSGDGEEQQWRSRWFLQQWSSSPLFCFSLSPLFLLVSYLCFPVSVFFLFSSLLCFFFFFFSPVSAACFPLFSQKFLLLCPLPVFILFFTVYSLAVAVLSVVLVVVAGGHGGERNRERSSCWEPGQKMIVS